MSDIHRTPQWKATVRLLRPVFKSSVDNGTARCIKCGNAVTPLQVWECGHRQDAATLLDAGFTVAEACAPELIGIIHRRCNRQAGGRLGRERQTHHSRDNRKLPTAW